MRGIGRNFGIIVGAFVITLLINYTARTGRMVETECDIPLSYVSLPDTLVRMGEAPAEVRVHVMFKRKFWQNYSLFLLFF